MITETLLHSVRFVMDQFCSVLITDVSALSQEFYNSGSLDNRFMISL